LQASMSPAPSGWRKILGPAKRSSPSLPTMARAISPSCSIRNSCARRNCPCRSGLNANRTSSRHSKRTDMPTDCLFRGDSYLKTCDARVVAFSEQGNIVLDRTVFYATSGGQPGDAGELTTETGLRIPISTAVYTDPAKTEIAHVSAANSPALKVGDRVIAAI